MQQRFTPYRDRYLRGTIDEEEGSPFWLVVLEGSLCGLAGSALPGSWGVGEGWSIVAQRVRKSKGALFMVKSKQG